MNLNPNTIYEWEQHQSISYMDMLFKIADYFEVTINYFTGKKYIFESNETQDESNSNSTNELVVAKIMKLMNQLTPETREFAFSRAYYLIEHQNDKA